MNLEINLPRKLFNQLLHLAQISPDQEVCGLIAEKQGLPINCYPIENAANTPENRFLLNSEQQIAAIRQMRENGENLYAIYHSHPKTPAFPSKIDIEMAAYPEAIYLIISLNTKGILEMRAFRFMNKAVQELPLVLIEA